MSKSNGFACIDKSMICNYIDDEEKYMANIQIRIDDELKNQANEIFDFLGIDMSTAIRMFLKKTVAEKGIPFSVMTNDERNEFDKVFSYFHEQAKKNGLDKMTLEEINQIIEKTRKDRNKKNN